MAGGLACMVPGAAAPIRSRSTIKNHKKILFRLPKPNRKFSALLRNSHKNPLFALKTQISLLASHRPQTRTLVAAEPIVSYIVGRVGDLLLEEAELFSGVHHKFKRIQTELEHIQSFLKDADSKQMKDPLVRKRLEEIIKLSYEVEDVIDDFVSSESTEERTKLGTEENVRSKAREIRTRQNVGKERKIIRISGWIEIYGIREGRRKASSSTPTPQDLRRYNALVVEEPEVVGLHEEIYTLKEHLRSEEPSRRVISVVGMPGSGKTTLARKVYDDVKDDFDCHAFLCLSQEHEIKDVLMRIIKCVMDLPREDEERMAQLTEAELRKKLQKHLKEKRYLVVIDDIWSTEEWDMLKPMLPDVGNKSRVILTTRIEDVVPSSPHLKKRLLNDDEAWELLIKKIFSGENPSTACPSELEETGRKILAVCRGQPLAILALGGALANKEDMTPIGWSEVLESVNNHLTESPNWCTEILAWSFWELPCYLKPCFLYFGLFPKDYEIDSMRLINLWIAEGFIQQSDNKIMEDVAEQYLKELVSRNMIQASGYMSDGSIAKCRIHDLLRRLSISKAGENNFFTIHDVDGTHSLPDNVRRLALHRNFDRVSLHRNIDRVSLHRNIDRYRPTKSLRSVLNFSNLDVFQLKLSDAKFLRVVSQEYGPGISGSTLTKEVKEFAHLRYLELSGGESLLSSIGDLNNLQTLIVDPSDTPLPNAVSNLKKLRHLAAIGNGEQGNIAVKNLTNLQTLCLRTGSWMEDGFSKLTNLRKLEISGNISLYHEALRESIDKLKNLRSLSLLSGSHIPPFLSLRLHPHLYQMSLDGRIEILPELPPYLAELALSNSNLQQDAISKLEKLPHLKILRITNEPNLSKKMTFSSGGFLQLELLELIRLPEEWVIEEGAMPSLKGVLLHEMPDDLKAETLPERVRVLLKQYYSIQKRNTA
ncbi:putative disease resistance protein [Cinnamomum micranthum f. kanehirae]|uniref:Putative disease resistance protein n=1 Tax=Cinnamomum micranthum f. kanehirae TaxID=337451 RepID=A0A443P0H2_9MAGN|nr:putative disease resistance protein [Cinnamomum micranthum f. kanehirae]